MSVPSKALRFAILVGVAAIFSSCATRSALIVTEPSERQAELQEEDAYYGDSSATAAIGESSNDPAVIGSAEIESAASLPAEETQELLAKNEANALGIGLERGPGFSRYVIDLSEANEPVVDVMMLKDPSRLVVDLLGEDQGMNREIALGGDAFLKGIRVGAHQDRTRFVFDMSGDPATGVDHNIDTGPGQLVVTFLDSSTVATPDMAATSELSEQADTAEIVAAQPLTEVAEEEVVELPVPAMEEEVVETAQLEEEAQVSEEAAAEPELAQALTLDSVNFQKTNNDAGNIILSMSDAAAFELKRSAPSEYIVTIPGATAASRTTLPQITPKGFPGIRSARAVEQNDAVIVRMFVDPAVELQAFPRGEKIVIEARALAVAAKQEPRAQMQVADLPQDEGEDGGDTEARRNPTGIRSADGSKIYMGRIISLDLQDTDIDNALRIIAEVSNLNIIASDDVSGKVTLRLIDVPWDQALDVILKTNGLDQVTEGNVIRIAPVDKLRQEREALREAKRAAENLEDLTVQYVRVSYARVSEMIDQVQAVLSERGTVTEDERTNQLIVKDIKKGHDQAIDLIKRLDLRTPQVLLETQIIEGSRNVLRDLGFQWNFTYVQSPETGNATGQNFPNTVAVGGSAQAGGGQLNAFQFPAVIDAAAGSAISAILDSADGSKSLSARVSALETEGRVKVISRPQVATVNNKQAEIKSVETIRVRLPDSGTSIATGSGASAQGGGRTAFEEIDVGIELRVTPQASPDYYVLMDVEARSSTFGDEEVDGIPSTLERDATSTILVKSGQTFALGGVYRLSDTDRISGVPFFKDIPFLGWLFRRTLVNKADEELIFFITPHIVEGSFDPSLM